MVEILLYSLHFKKTKSRKYNPQHFDVSAFVLNWLFSICLAKARRLQNPDILLENIYHRLNLISICSHLMQITQCLPKAHKAVMLIWKRVRCWELPPMICKWFATMRMYRINHPRHLIQLPSCPVLHRSHLEKLSG